MTEKEYKDLDRGDLVRRAADEGDKGYSYLVDVNYGKAGVVVVDTILISETELEEWDLVSKASRLDELSNEQRVQFIDDLNATYCLWCGRPLRVDKLGRKVPCEWSDRCSTLGQMLRD